VKNRKKKIISIQLIIFLFASFLLYSTYKEKNEVNEEFVKIKVESNADSNSFTDVEYSGFDLNGNPLYFRCR